MKKKCCHVRMLSPNKSCSKDNLYRVIDVQQYNPLIHQQLRESKIQAVTHIIICYHRRATRQIHRVLSSCCATQRETKWQAPGRRAKKYGPATIREAQIAVSEVFGRLGFNTAAFRDCWNGARATGCHLQHRWKTDLVARRVLRRRKPGESAIFQWSNKLSTVLMFSLCFAIECFSKHLQKRCNILNITTLHFFIHFFS